MAKKGLVLVYDPHNLLQYIWYYCTYGTDKKWDALCLPNAHKGEYMSAYCKKSGIFENVISDDKSFLNSSLVEQLGLFTKMTGNALVGRQKKYCEKVLRQYVNLDDYDEIVILTDVGLISGYFMTLADTKRVVILEDGIGDYVERTYKNIVKNITVPMDWKGFFLSAMGYSNVGHRYPLRTTKNCIKFSSHPEVMPYQNYKEHLNIFDFGKTDMELYDSIIRRTYEAVAQYDFDNYDTVLFSCHLKDFVDNTDEYQKKIQDYISSNAKGVLIKKHPRDTMEYKFDESLDACEVPQSIPAEVILPYIKGKRVIFMQATSIMLYMKPDEYDAECIYFDGLYDESVKEVSTFCNYITKKELKTKLSVFKCENIKISTI